MSGVTGPSGGPDPLINDLRRRIEDLEIANSALVRTLTIVRDAEIDCHADGDPMMPRVVFHEVCRAIQLGRGSLPAILPPEPISFFCPQGPGKMHQWRERRWQTEDHVHMHAMICACGAEWGREPDVDVGRPVPPHGSGPAQVYRRRK